MKLAPGGAVFQALGGIVPDLCKVFYALVSGPQAWVSLAQEEFTAIFRCPVLRVAQTLQTLQAGPLFWAPGLRCMAFDPYAAASGLSLVLGYVTIYHHSSVGRAAGGVRGCGCGVFPWGLTCLVW